jgi:diadenosine tetraphosphate (Ap4A) HIT family hydrolase
MVPEQTPAWSLDSRLAADTIGIGDLPLSRLLASKDANYPWLILVPRRAGMREIIDLDDADQAQLTVEIRLASRALKAVTACDKLNVAALGNVVPQLHVHVVARRIGDAAWPAPVWGHAAPRAYEQAALDRFIGAMQGKLGLGDV